MDELVMRMRNEAETERYLLPHSDNGTAALLDKAADAIEELQEDNAALNGTVSNLIQQIAELGKQKWIPVTERLPEDLTRVIVYCEDGVSFGLCEHLIADDDEEVVEWHDFLYYPITPTHWMPLPEPPKE